jgi:hypothetical protein
MVNILFLRGTKAQNDNYTGAEGAITYDITSQNLRIHDGRIPGGHYLPNTTAVSQSIENYLFLHSLGGDHDARYFTKDEVQQQIYEKMHYEVSDAPPADPMVGQPWVDTTNMLLFVYYNDAWVQVVGEQGPPGIAPTKEELLLEAGFVYDVPTSQWLINSGLMA